MKIGQLARRVPTRWFVALSFAPEAMPEDIAQRLLGDGLIAPMGEPLREVTLKDAHLSLMNYNRNPDGAILLTYAVKEAE